jgi:crossover junction endodeoxyribonuclease RusA
MTVPHGQAVSFIVPGTPVPKERPCPGRGGHFYTPKRTRQYDEELVAWAARQAGLQGPCAAM